MVRINATVAGSDYRAAARTFRGPETTGQMKLTARLLFVGGFAAVGIVLGVLGFVMNDAPLLFWGAVAAFIGVAGAYV